MNKSEEIKARAERYSRVEREADTIGRLIGVRRLKPSEQVQVEEWSPNLDGYSTEKDEFGNEFSVPRRFRLFVASAVCELDGNPVPFPKSRGELNSILNSLDTEGIQAAVKGLVRLNEGDKPVDVDAPKLTVADEAKNS